MGLDQMAYRTKDDRCRGAFQIPEDHEFEFIFRWRKHPNLHGWMRELYLRKATDEGHEEFNAGQGVELTTADLDALEQTINQNALPVTQGFFFGQSFGDEKDRDLIFINQARIAIYKGYRVYYTSWW